MFNDLSLLRRIDVSNDAEAALNLKGVTMFPPPRAWHILCERTGARVSLVTFYRWVRNGKVFSIRMGQRIFIPQPALEDTIKQCLAGERF